MFSGHCLAMSGYDKKKALIKNENYLRIQNNYEDKKQFCQMFRVECVVLYGWETWTINEQDKNNIRMMNMWLRKCVLARQK